MLSVLFYSDITSLFTKQSGIFCSIQFLHVSFFPPYLALLFFFLPVFNMLGLAFSQIRKRQPEIGLRKAFGATSAHVVGQMLYESLIVTGIGCVLGQCFSVLFFFLAKDGLLERTDVKLTTDMLFTFWLLPIAFLICLFINFLSVGIPAWRIARRQIVEALNA